MMGDGFRGLNGMKIGVVHHPVSHLGVWPGGDGCRTADVHAVIDRAGFAYV